MNTMGFEIQDAVTDMRREPTPDAPTEAECLVEWGHTLKLLQEDGDGVPPWMTIDECIDEAEAEIERLRVLA